MTVLTFATGDRFTVRITKFLNTNPGNKWANSYELTARTAGVETDLLVIGEALVAFEVAFHYTSTIFAELLMSTWEADSVPYNPATFIASTLSDVGAVAATSDPLALNQCMSVTRVASSGRFGHIFYRNCVAEEDVGAPAGTTRFNDRSVFQGRVDVAASSSGLQEAIDPGGDSLFQLSMINKDGSQVRPVRGLIVQGMSTVPLDHAWFNRTTP